MKVVKKHANSPTITENSNKWSDLEFEILSYDFKF